MSNEKEMVVRSIAMRKDDYEKIKIIAAKQCRTISGQIRIAILSHIDEWDSYFDEESQ